MKLQLNKLQLNVVNFLIYEIQALDHKSLYNMKLYMNLKVYCECALDNKFLNLTDFIPILEHILNF